MFFSLTDAGDLCRKNLGDDPLESSKVGRTVKFRLEVIDPDGPTSSVVDYVGDSDSGATNVAWLTPSGGQIWTTITPAERRSIPVFLGCIGGVQVLGINVKRPCTPPPAEREPSTFFVGKAARSGAAAAFSALAGPLFEQTRDLDR